MFVSVNIYFCKFIAHTLWVLPLSKYKINFLPRKNEQMNDSNESVANKHIF